MKSGVADHVPWVEFEDAECVALDKDFFRAAFDLAAQMRGRHTAYIHRAGEDINGLLVELAGVTRGGMASPERAHETLIKIAATAARNARLMSHMKSQAAKAGAS
jgi:hypothetical protein